MKTTRKIRATDSPPSNNRPLRRHLVLPLVLIGLTGCATTASQQIEPVPILEAQREIPEAQLLDVGILVFESETISADKEEKEGTTPDIRNAERHFIPYHLKDTMQRTSQWGAVRVVPAATDSADLLVSGVIIESNGEHLAVRIRAADAAGTKWLDKEYRMTANKTVYGGQPGRDDPFQNVYNAIANDLVRFKEKLKPDEITAIRKTAQLKFAAEFAPAAFGGYLRDSDGDRPVVLRLPADDDPMMARVMRIRDREYMFVDTINAHYEKFHATMRPSYDNWRELNLDERMAIKKVKREAMYRQLAGALLIAGAVALGTSGRSNTGGLQVGMVIVGGQVLIDGFNVSKGAEIHSEAIKELGESFGNEMKTVTMEFEGRQVELTGSAEEQYRKWRSLLQQIYYKETGFEPPPTEELRDPPSEDIQ